MPCESKPWREVGERRVLEEIGAWRDALGARFKIVEAQETGDPSLGVGWDGEKFIPQAVIDGQVFACLPLVLREEREVALAHGALALWSMEILSLAFIAMGVFILVIEPGKWLRALATIVFFGLCAGVFAFMLVIRRQRAGAGPEGLSSPVCSGSAGVPSTLSGATCVMMPNPR